MASRFEGYLRTACRRTRKVLAIVWASPWTLLGLLIGLAGLLTGGGVQFRRGAIEFWGGRVTWLLENFPLVAGAAAMTLGHVILGQSRRELEHCRDHELVHVRQYEQWGPMFIPAYVLCSLVLWLRGKDFYWNNPFEVAAYDETGW